MTEYEIVNCLQGFLHKLNLALRPNGDSVFCNVSLFSDDLLKNTFKDVMYPDGTGLHENMHEIHRLQEYFAEFMSKGSPVTGLPYPFPILSVCIGTNSENKIIDEHYFNKMCDLNREKHIFNFFVGNRLSSCCRLSSDMTQLKKKVKQDSFGNGGISIGSSRVVTINLHRLAFLAQNSPFSFEKRLKEEIKIAEKLLLAHRNIFRKRIKEGFYQIFNAKWASEHMYFCTFGVTGIWDAAKILGSDDYISFANAVFKQIDDHIEAIGPTQPTIAWNVENIPGETACVTLAKKDRCLFDTTTEILSNQLVPLYEDMDFDGRCTINGLVGANISGGDILHIPIDQVPTQGANRDLHRLLIEHYGIQHFGINRIFGICPSGHVSVDCGSSIVGAERKLDFVKDRTTHDPRSTKCTVCQAPIIDAVTRVVGFFSKVSNWNPTRRKIDYPNRQIYSIPKDK